jgi:hypothetical protein
MWLGIARIHVYHSLLSVVGCMGPPDHAFDHTYMLVLTALSGKHPHVVCTAEWDPKKIRWAPDGFKFSQTVFLTWS